MTDALYSLALLLALVAASACLVLGAATRLGRLPGVARPWARAAGWTAIGCGLVSLAVHVAFGHRPGTAEALGPASFVALHPAYLGVVASAVLGLRLASHGR